MDNETWFRAEHPEFVSLPQHFKANGYAALRAGKIFHGGIDDTDAWTEGGEARGFAGARRPPNTANANGPSRASQSDRIVVLEGEGESNGDYRTATRAIGYLERHKDRPFFLAVGFAKPHSPPAAPKKFFDLYDPAKIFDCRPISLRVPRRRPDFPKSLSRGATPIYSSGATLLRRKPER
jgi:arylsulfatase A-like enzyme